MKNILLISIDSVRADVAYNSNLPTLDNLAADGIKYINCISSSPLTPVSHATVLTGLQPFNHGVRHLFKEKMNDKRPTLAEILKLNGYKTRAIVSCPGMNSWYGFSRGFDIYDDEIPKLTDGSDALLTVDVEKRGLAMKRAKDVVDRAISHIDELDNNFFLFVHFFDAHWPYNPPKKYGGKNKYEEEVFYTDHHLGRLINHLKEINKYKDTTIILFSDHGEDLGGWYPNDKAGDKYGNPDEKGHGTLLYDQTIMTVLIIKDSRIKKNQTVIDQVRLVDIMPTILDLLDIKTDNQFDGFNLLKTTEEEGKQLLGYSETFFPEEIKSGISRKKSFRLNNTYKVIIGLDNDAIEFYNLIADPNEQNNMFKTIDKNA